MNMRREVVMAAIILLSTISVLPQTSAGGLGSEDPGVTDTVTWRVGDKWVYAGAFDPTVLVPVSYTHLTLPTKAHV